MAKIIIDTVLAAGERHQIEPLRDKYGYANNLIQEIAAGLRQFELPRPHWHVFCMVAEAFRLRAGNDKAYWSKAMLARAARWIEPQPFAAPVRLHQIDEPDAARFFDVLAAKLNSGFWPLSEFEYAMLMLIQAGALARWGQQAQKREFLAFVVQVVRDLSGASIAEPVMEKAL